MKGHVARIQADGVDCVEISESLMQEMRSSIIFLGALLGRYGSCTLSYPGGCELGPRPIDMHLQALRSMGAEIVQNGGRLLCRAAKGLRGKKISFKYPSVGATENIMLAAVLAKGTTVIYNAAREPEICDLASFCGSAEQIFTVMAATLSRLKAFLHYMEQFTGLCQTALLA